MGAAQGSELQRELVGSAVLAPSTLPARNELKSATDLAVIARLISLHSHTHTAIADRDSGVLAGNSLGIPLRFSSIPLLHSAPPTLPSPYIEKQNFVS